MRQIAAALAVSQHSPSELTFRTSPTPEERAVRRAYVRRERARRVARRRTALARMSAGVVPSPR